MQAESLEPFPDLTQPEIAFVPYPASGYDPQLTVQLPDLYLRILDMEDLVELARQAIVSKAEEVARSSSSGIVGPVVLDLPCTFFMLRSLRSTSEAFPLIYVLLISLATIILWLTQGKLQQIPLVIAFPPHKMVQDISQRYMWHLELS